MKEAAQGYLDHVARLRLGYRELCVPLAHTAVRHLALQASENNEAALEELTSAILSGSARARIPRRRIIESRASLNFETFEGMFTALGLGMGEFETKKALINQGLCENRHAIAHGKDRYPTAGRVQELLGDVFGMMETARDVIAEAVYGRAYRCP